MFAKELGDMDLVLGTSGAFRNGGVVLVVELVRSSHYK